MVVTVEGLPVSMPMSETIRITAAKQSLMLFRGGLVQIMNGLTDFNLNLPFTLGRHKGVTYDIFATHFSTLQHLFTESHTKLLQTYSGPHQHVVFWPIISHSTTHYHIMTLQHIYSVLKCSLAGWFIDSEHFT